MDLDLVESAQRGDQAAFMALIRPRSDRLFGIAQRILRDVDQAEDALQDALVIAWRDLRGLRDPDRFDAWLRKLLVNIIVDVDGTRLIILISIGEGTSEAEVAAARAIVESFEITP